MFTALMMLSMITSFAVYAAEFGTGTTVTNNPPVFNAGPSDGGSSVATPTIAGNDVVFTATATDSNSDQYYLAICKSDAITPNNNQAPECTGGSWAISPVTDSGSQASVTYTTSSGDAETNAWYGFVCDKNPSGACSVSSQGSGDNGSPFYVVQGGTFGTATVTDSSDGTIAPGDTLKFNLPLGQVADPYNVKMYICASATTAFDYGNDSCTNGTLICASTLTDPSSSDVICTGGASLISIPTAHGDYDYKIFVEDEFSNPVVGTETQSYTVINVPPALVNFSITDAPNPVAGSSDNMDFDALVQDDNGEDEIISADGSFYDSGATQNWTNGLCSDDEKKCYNDLSCSINTGAGNSAQASVSCSVTMWFNANASTGWKAHINASDASGKVTDFSDSDSMENPPISGIDIAEASISYGTVVIGSTSNSVETSMGNMGNQIIDIYLYGTDMISGINSISASQQKWDHVSGNFNWDDPASGTGPYLLVTESSGTGDSSGCLNRDIQVRAVHDSVSTNESIYWRLKIPNEQPAGSYAGQNTFSTTSGDTCSAGVSY